MVPLAVPWRLAFAPAITVMLVGCGVMLDSPITFPSAKDILRARRTGIRVDFLGKSRFLSGEAVFLSFSWQTCRHGGGSRRDEIWGYIVLPQSSEVGLALAWSGQAVRTGHPFGTANPLLSKVASTWR